MNTEPTIPVDDRAHDLEAARCQHVTETPWGRSQCALAADHTGPHAYSPSEGPL